MKTAARHAEAVFIAADLHREGETIGWHIAQLLGLHKPHGVVYQEITEVAVRAAIACPRPLDIHQISRVFHANK
ncbi:hypothetical protein DO97_19145 [Neosynechococcus sphagnicola sy1]|uniref:Toprim domain-containing protein n=1 Tax=Neosynechococcus sphagnicola sy1 TaxID=1497020 RepID=A0A098TS78_9CYAN|nr:toprim domain-containing protein [Neosynechococcus sphagnicola]KGF73588.1 hypothetical protein DO97_19145 [Neosynechococcus sphagnicola sy1]